MTKPTDKKVPEPIKSPIVDVNNDKCLSEADIFAALNNPATRKNARDVLSQVGVDAAAAISRIPVKAETEETRLEIKKKMAEKLTLFVSKKFISGMNADMLEGASPATTAFFEAADVQFPKGTCFTTTGMEKLFDQLKPAVAPSSHKPASSPQRKP